ncbi:MAG TPA: DUF4129 domain-containing protein [Mycobacterium sp.]|jgi:hypothetical protein|nr:DUF4129 domain-containing protein [Mycobacterium sp.]
MTGIDKSTRRAIAVVALLVVAAFALRGYLPGVEREVARERPHNSTAALLIDVALLSGTVVIMGIAIVARMRDRRAKPPRRARGPEGSGTIGRPSWRFVLIALGLIVAWLFAIMLLTRVVGPAPPTDQPSSGPAAVSEQTQAPRNRATDQPRPNEPTDSGPNVVGYLVPPMVVLLVLVVVGTVIASRRQARAAKPHAHAGNASDLSVAPAPAESLARAAELGLAEIGDLSREPREAIIACYTAMERELMHVPGAVPQDYDTPTEVLARAVEHHALATDSATQLVELFEEARFSPHVMNEGHRDVALQVLRLVLTELRSAV